MTTRPVSFEVDQFEYVVATPGTMLLRVAGRWRCPYPEWLSNPVLLIDDGHRTHSLSPLPGPDDGAPLGSPDGRPWRAAFSAPSALLADSRTRFALDVGPHGLADLPSPRARGQRAPARPSSDPIRQHEPEERSALADDRRRRRRMGVEEAADARRVAMRDLEERLEHERAARLAAEQRVEAERDASARVRDAGEGALRARGERLALLEVSLVEQTSLREAAEQEAKDAAEQTRLAHDQLETRLADERTLRLRAEEAAVELRAEAQAEITRLRDAAQAESQQLIIRAAEEMASVRSEALSDLEEERRWVTAELAARAEQVEEAREEERSRAEHKLAERETTLAQAASRAAAERERLDQERDAAAEVRLTQAREEAEAAVQAERRSAGERLQQANAATAAAAASARDQLAEELAQAAHAAKEERVRASALESALARAAAEAEGLARELQQRTAEVTEAQQQLASGRAEVEATLEAERVAARQMLADVSGQLEEQHKEAERVERELATARAAAVTGKEQLDESLAALEKARELASVAHESAQQRAEGQRVAETRLAATIEMRRAADLRAERADADRSAATQAIAERNAAQARASAAVEKARRLATGAAGLEQRLADQRAEAERAGALEQQLLAEVATRTDLEDRLAELGELRELADERARTEHESRAELDRAREAAEVLQNERDGLVSTLDRERTRAADSLAAASEENEELRAETVALKDVAAAEELRAEAAALKAVTAAEETRRLDDALSAAHVRVAELDAGAQALAPLQARLAELEPVGERLAAMEPEAQRLGAEGDRLRDEATDAALRVAALEAELTAVTDRRREAEDRAAAAENRAKSAVHELAAAERETTEALDRATEAEDAATRATDRAAAAEAAQADVQELLWTAGEQASAEVQRQTARADEQRALAEQRTAEAVAMAHEREGIAQQIARLEAALAAADAARGSACVELETAHERARVLTDELADAGTQQSAVRAEIKGVKATVADALELLEREQGAAAAAETEAREAADRRAAEHEDEAGLLPDKLEQAHSERTTAAAETLPVPEAGEQAPAIAKQSLIVSDRLLGTERVGPALRRLGVLTMAAAVLTAIAYGAAVAPVLTIGGVMSVLLGATVLLRPDFVLLVLVAALPWEGALAPPAAPLPVVKLLGVALIASWIIQLATGQTTVKLPAVLVPVAAFLLAVGISFLAAPGLSASALRTASYVLFAIFFFIVVQLVTTREVLRRVLMVLSLSAAASGGRGLFDFLVLGVPRAAGPILDPNDFAYVMASVLPIAGYLAVTERRLRWLWAACALILAAAVAGSLSRGAFVGLAAVLLWAVFTGRFRLRWVAVGGATLLLGAAMLAPVLAPAIGARLQQKSTYGAKNVDSRAALWRGALAMAEDRPLTGVGPGRFGAEAQYYVRRNPVNLTDPVVHNSYLEILAEGGILALGAFLAYLAVVWRLLSGGRRQALQDGHRADVLLASTLQSTLVVAIVGGIFISAQVITPFWLLGGLAAIFATMSTRSSRTPATRAHPPGWQPARIRLT